MDELTYILKRIVWLSKDKSDDDTYAEICDWVKRMENEVSYGDSGEDWFIEHLAELLRR